MSRKLRIVISIGVFMVVIAVAAVVFYQHEPMIERENNPHIALISATIGQGGETYDYDIPKSEISDELNDALISLFLNAEMRSTLFPPPENYTVSDGSVHITIKITLDGSSMYVYLCTVPAYNSAQIGDVHYHIVNHQKLYQAVYDLLSDVMPVYAVKR